MNHHDDTDRIPHDRIPHDRGPHDTSDDLDAAIRASMRDLAAAAPTTADGPAVGSKVTTGHHSRRLPAVAASVALLAATLGAIVATSRDRTDVAVSDEPGGPLSAPYPDADSEAPVDTTVGVTETLPPVATTRPDRGEEYALLTLDDVPEGFDLARARYLPGADGFGIARYAHPEHGTELRVTSRNFEFFSVERAEELGRTTWEVDGRTVLSDGEGDTCLSGFCSVGVQWDATTYVSISWVDPNAGDLVAGSTQDVLVGLVSQLIEDDPTWVELGPDVSDLEEELEGPLDDVGPLPTRFSGAADIVVTNRNTVGGSAGSLSALLEDAGFDVFDPENGTPGVAADSTIYAIDPGGCSARRLSSMLRIERIEPMPDPLPVPNPVNATPFLLVELGDDIASGALGHGEFVFGPDPGECAVR